MSDRDLERRIRELTWPGPAASLRTRVLSSAQPQPALSWVDRVWFSRAWRLGGACALMAFVTAVTWSTLIEPARQAPSSRLVLSDPGLALSDLGLPLDTIQALAIRQQAWWRVPSPAAGLGNWSALPLSDLTGDR